MIWTPKWKIRLGVGIAVLVLVALGMVDKYTRFGMWADEENAGTTQVAHLTDNRATYPNSKIPKYEKFELTFDINRLDVVGGSVVGDLNTEIEANTINPYWPYDPDPSVNQYWETQNANAPDWDINNSYVAGNNHVKKDGNIYGCSKNINIWKSGNIYSKDAIVILDGVAYKDIKDGRHTATDTDKPGTEGGSTFWAIDSTVNINITPGGSGNWQEYWLVNPPDPIPAGKGISVDGLFLPSNETDWSKAVVQPAFYYQDYEMQRNLWAPSKSTWLYPQNKPIWKVRYAPTQTGTFKFAIKVQDSSGVINYYPNQTFAVTDSSNKGFARVSSEDGRYFETDNGDYMNMTGLNDFTDGTTIASVVDERYPLLNSMGVNFLRTWWNVCQGPAVWGVSNSGGQTGWMYEKPEGGWGSVTPNYSVENVRPGELYSIPLNGADINGRTAGVLMVDIPVKPSTKYKISTWIKTKDVVGNGTAGVDYGAYLYFYPIGEPIDSSQAKIYGTNDWTQISALYTSKQTDKLLRFGLNMKNVTEGMAYVSSFSLKEDLTPDDPNDSSFGIEIISRPNFNEYQYVPSREAWQADYQIEAAKNNNIYLKVQLSNHEDKAWGGILPDGQGGPPNHNNVYGNDNWASRTYMQYYWHYVIARYGYSTAIHSFEFLNEGDPFNGNHYNGADRMAKYFEQNDPNRHLVSTSTWHSFPQSMWRDSNIDYADFHNAFTSYLWAGWDGNWAISSRNQKSLTAGFSPDGAMAHSGNNSLKITVPPNIDPATGQLNESDVKLPVTDANLNFYAGVEPGHKIGLSYWVKVSNLKNFSNSDGNMPGLNINYQVGEGGWNGWPNNSIRVAGNRSDRGPWTYDWKKVAFETYVPSYYNLFVDTSGKIHVANIGRVPGQTTYPPNHGYVTFNADEAEGKRTSSADHVASRGITVDSAGIVYMIDYENNRVVKYDQETKYYGIKGSGDKQFSSPEGIVVDGGGNIYIADTGNNRIEKLDKDGNFAWTKGSKGNGDGQFDAPTSLAVDKDGFVYVADKNNHRIVKLDSEGNQIMKFGAFGSGDGQLNSPSGLAVDSGGNIFVADTMNNRIQKFNNRGEFLQKWGSLGTDTGQFKEPQGVAIDGDGNMYIADTGNIRIQKFDQNGNYVRTYRDVNAGAFWMSVTPRYQSHAGSENAYVWIDDVEVKDLVTDRLLNYNGGFEVTDRSAYDVVAGYLGFSVKSASTQLNKPITQGEGYITAPQRFGSNYKNGSINEGDQLLYNDPNGTWWKKLTWAGIDSSGLIEMMWGTRNILYDKKYTFAKVFKDFMNGITLNNGKYKDINTSTSISNLRTLGQKQIDHATKKADKAHLWIDNVPYTWKAVADHNFNLADTAWNKEARYAIGSIASLGGKIYKSIKDDGDNQNKDHAPPNAVWWQEISQAELLSLLDMPSYKPALPAPISGTVTIPSMKSGWYKVEWWNTATGKIYKTELKEVKIDGKMGLSVVGLVSDTAVKVYPTVAPIGGDTAVKVTRVVVSKRHVNAKGVDRKHLSDEYIVIKNTGNTVVNLKGWYLKNRKKSKSTIRGNYYLKPNKSVTIRSGKRYKYVRVYGRRVKKRVYVYKTNIYLFRKTEFWRNSHDTIYMYSKAKKLMIKKGW